MSDPNCARALLDAADRDILTLREMTVRTPDESFGFHVQQAVEKAFKARLGSLHRRYQPPIPTPTDTDSPLMLYR
jgi:HEPN domain-containing protein